MSNIIDKIRLSGVTYTLSGQSGGGNPTVELTQAEYDALVSAGTVSADTYYIITDAQGVDLSNYWTSAQTQSAINQATSGKVDTSTFNTYSGSVETALSGKQDTLVSGTNIKTINNTSILGSGNIDIQGGGGGGKAVSGGTNISITTGETVDTINCTLPITADTKHNYHFIHSYNTSGSENVTFGTNNDINANGSFIVGGSNHAYGNGSFIHGYSCIANKVRSHLVGDNLLSRNSNESSFGKYNSTTSASTTFGDSGNTLFSVGNGTADNARHNAFEIRQNGDIYCSDGTNDVKLQDTITATAANTTALGGLSLVKLTQNEYDALANKDNSTLYVIVN